MIQHLGHVALQNFIDYSRTNRSIQQVAFVEHVDTTRKHSNRTNFTVYAAEFVPFESVSNIYRGAKFSND